MRKKSHPRKMKPAGIIFYSILYVFCSGCLKGTHSDATQGKNSTDSTLESNSAKRSQSERVGQLIQTILELPEVLELSTFDKASKQHEHIYIVIPENLDAPANIKLKDYQLTLLQSTKDLPDNQPCYRFTKLEVNQDFAIVQLLFDMTGMIVYGRVNYKNGAWIPDENFIVGFQ
jgi:hypothetical protein